MLVACQLQMHMSVVPSVCWLVRTSVSLVPGCPWGVPVVWQGCGSGGWLVQVAPGQQAAVVLVVVVVLVAEVVVWFVAGPVLVVWQSGGL